MERRHREPEREPAVPVARVAPPVAPAVGRILALQAGAGNAAVAGLLARQARPWDERVRAAQATRPGSAEHRHAYLGLLMHALARGPYDIWITDGMTYAPLPVINFDPRLDSEGRTLTTAGAVPRLPAEPDAPASAPELAVILGPRSVIEDSPAYTAWTLTHEMTHARHFERGFELRAQWVAGGRHGPFASWLEREHRRGRLTEAELRTTREMAGGQLLTTELLAPAEAFISGFAALPVGPGHEESMHQLTLVATGFGAADDPVSAEVLTRIAGFARGLDPVHHAALAAFAAERAGQPHEGESVVFWRRLADQVR